MRVLLPLLPPLLLPLLLLPLLLLPLLLPAVTELPPTLQFEPKSGVRSI